MANSGPPRANVSLSAIPLAIQKLTRRLDELKGEHILEAGKTDILGMSKLMNNKINAAIEDVFGAGTADAADFRVENSWFHANFSGANWDDRVVAFDRALRRATETVAGAIERLQEKAADAEEEASGRALRAYEGLELHPEIARAASELYRDEHYANAVEASVKALNDLVRLRSGLEHDGTALMEKAFSPKNPILKFNDLSNQSDHDEQRGFMMMFWGAVSGLRNPRAHGFIHDDPERALEFIAFVSLLAKLLDDAKR